MGVGGNWSLMGSLTWMMELGKVTIKCTNLSEDFIKKNSNILFVLKKNLFEIKIR
jgi:hypothetical protein